MPRKNHLIARVVLVALVVGLLGGLLAQATPLTARPVVSGPASADSFVASVWTWLNHQLLTVLHLGAPQHTVSIQKDGGSPDNNVLPAGVKYGIGATLNP
jgi:hypothetical protein